MSASSPSLTSATLLSKVLARVPSVSHPILVAVCKTIKDEMGSLEFRNKRIASGWGPDVFVSQLKSTRELVGRLQQWATTFPDIRGVENMWLATDQVHEFNDGGREGENRVRQIAQVRIGGPQVPCDSLYEQQFGHNEFGFKVMHPLRVDPKGASTQLRDLWWIVVRSLMDGTPLPSSMNIVAFIQSENFRYGATSGYDTDRLNVKLVVLARAGSEYALLTTCRAHVAFHVQWKIQAWVGVPADWGKSTFMSLCHDFASTRLQSFSDPVDLCKVDSPVACNWSDSWTHDLDSDPSCHFNDSDNDPYSDNDSDNDSTGLKVSHKVSAWPFKEPLSINAADASNRGPGARFLPGTPGVRICPVEAWCSGSRSNQPTSTTSTPQGVLQQVETNYDDIIDSGIPHVGEVPVSSEEAFARTAERHISADRFGIPAAQLSADWPQSAHVEVNASTGIQMTEMQASLEASTIEDPPGNILCLEFSRTPKSFHEALDTSTILMECHNDLNAVGLCCKLESGTRLYLLPEQHADTVRAIVDLNLQSRHVVASARFVEAVTQAIAAIKGREQVREKKRQRVDYEQEFSNASKNESDLGVEIPVLIKNTFIHIPLPASLCSMSSSGPATASTTDADARKGRNPR